GFRVGGLRESAGRRGRGVPLAQTSVPIAGVKLSPLRSAPNGTFLYHRPEGRMTEGGEPECMPASAGREVRRGATDVVAPPPAPPARRSRERRSKTGVGEHDRGASPRRGVSGQPGPGAGRRELPLRDRRRKDT